LHPVWEEMKPATESRTTCAVLERTLSDREDRYRKALEALAHRAATASIREYQQLRDAAATAHAAVRRAWIALESQIQKGDASGAGAL
jgi:hypothetical protein